MTTDTAPAGDTRMGCAGSAARLAVLLHLAAHPDGASTDELAAVILAATDRPLERREPARLLYRMRRNGRIACQRRGPAAGLWYSPAARQAAELRRTAARTPVITRPTSDPVTQEPTP